MIGRTDEIAAVQAFLDSLLVGPAALFLSGEPGIGESTVWRAGLAEARSRSFRVLLCRPVEAEAGLSFVALGDLLADVPEEVLTSPPGPQGAAIEIALQRADSLEEVDRVALARGVLAVVTDEASRGPTIVAVDDAQWLDAPSRDVLRFVCRRLVDEPVGLFATVRGEPTGAPLDVDAALPPERITHLALGQLVPGNSKPSSVRGATSRFRPRAGSRSTTSPAGTPSTRSRLRRPWPGTVASRPARRHRYRRA